MVTVFTFDITTKFLLDKCFPSSDQSGGDKQPVSSKIPVGAKFSLDSDSDWNKLDIYLRDFSYIEG